MKVYGTRVRRGGIRYRNESLLAGWNRIVE